MNSALIEEKVTEKTYSARGIIHLNKERIPEHVAIIMDGNRRWAKKRGLLPMAGHRKGAETLTQITRVAGDLGVKTLTVYAFSTENWKRAPFEVHALMKLFKTYLIKQCPVMIDEGVRLNVIGDVSKFPKDVRDTLEKTLVATEKGRRFDLVLALNYGGRDEIKRAICSIVEDYAREKISKEEISEKLIGQYLDTAKWRDPDLLIRTSGESRISNFLLWQISYSEVVVTDVLWPDFSEKELLNALLEYQKRELRLGR